MGLARALTLMHGDRGTESVARDVLQVMVSRSRPELTAEGVRRKLPLLDRRDIGAVLEALADGVVLDFDSASASYRFHADPALDFEVRRFIRRADVHDQGVRANVDRFRRRYGRG
jgi:hypothetical protein